MDYFLLGRFVFFFCPFSSGGGGRQNKTNSPPRDEQKQFRTYQLAKELVREARTLKLKGELRNQLERASLSVALNLTEGSAKVGKERVRFFTMAMGSLREIQAIFDIIDAADLVAKADVV